MPFWYWMVVVLALSALLAGRVRTASEGEWWALMILLLLSIGALIYSSGGLVR